MVTATDLDNLEFNVIKETWNEYELKDGTKIRGRLFLTRISENKNAPKPKNLKPGQHAVDYAFQIQKHFEVFAPNELIDKPTLPLPPINSITDDMKQEVDPLTYSEPWNVYEIIKNGTIIKMKLVVSEFHEVKNEFDALGQPYYIMKNGPVFDVKMNVSKQKFA